MKKFLSFIAVLLVLLVAFALASCENVNTGDDGTDTTTEEKVETRDVNKDEEDDESEESDGDKTEKATSEEETSTAEETTTVDAPTTDTKEETTTDTTEESTTEEAVSSPVVIDPKNTKKYEDDYVSFNYPGEDGWEAMIGDYFGGSITYLEYVSVDISASEASGLHGISKEDYESVYVAMYEELLGMKISGLSVATKTNGNGVNITVIEQNVTMDMEGEALTMEMDMMIVPAGDLEVTVSITKMAPADALNTMIFDSIEVVYYGGGDDDNSGENSSGNSDGGPSGDTWTIENLFVGNVEGFLVEPQKLAPGASVATKFTVDDSAGLFGVYIIQCPSWNDSIGTLKVSLYRWIDGEGETEQARLKAGYKNTVSPENLVWEESFVNYRDNATLWLEMSEEDVEAGGTYLVVLSNPNSTDYGVGYLKSGYDARAYYNGQIKYQLPTNISSYQPVYTSDVVSFNTKGVPSTSGYMALAVELMT